MDHITLHVCTVLYNTERKLHIYVMLFGCSVKSDSVTPWSVVHQASLSFTISWSLLRLLSIESVIPSNHPNLCHPLLLLPSIFPRIRVFSNDWLFTSGGQSIGVSASASVLPMNFQERRTTQGRWPVS